MSTPEGFQFTTIYDMRWGESFKFADFYLVIYRCDDVRDKFILDPKGNIIAFRDLAQVSNYRRFCDVEYLSYPSPLHSFPHVASTGKLHQGDAVEVSISSAIGALTKDEFDSTDNLFEFLSVIDELLTGLKHDHKNVSHGHSAFIARMCMIRRALVQTGLVGDAFSDVETRSKFVSECKSVLDYIMGRIVLVS